MRFQFSLVWNSKYNWLIVHLCKEHAHTIYTHCLLPMFDDEPGSLTTVNVIISSATSPPSFALEVFVHCDGESRFRRLCQPFLYSHSSSNVLEVEVWYTVLSFYFVMFSQLELFVSLLFFLPISSYCLCFARQNVQGFNLVRSKDCRSPWLGKDPRR